VRIGARSGWAKNEGSRDRDQWCSVLQARFWVDEIDALRSVLGQQVSDDAELQHQYVLDEDELAAVVTRFNVGFDPGQLSSKDLDIFLFRRRLLADTPYLVHTGYELPLLLDGRKKLARMSDGYPPQTFEGEDRFDRSIAQGLLHKEEVLQPFDPPTKRWAGVRTIYYTPKGEEWRISASKFIWGEFGKTGEWNETIERLEGILFGYGDWQNDWWMEYIIARGGSFSGLSLCCAVTAGGLASIESAGFRALPPVDGSTMRTIEFDPDNKVEMRAFMSEEAASVALVRFNVLGRHLMDIFDLRRGGPWEVPSDRIPELNRHLRGSLIIAARSDDPYSGSQNPIGPADK
jgi:hypothetical protein